MHRTGIMAMRTAHGSRLMAQALIHGSRVPSLKPAETMIKRRRSKLHGWGVFADQRINKNKRIIDYAGEKISPQALLVRNLLAREKISHQQSLRREQRYM